MNTENMPEDGERRPSVAVAVIISIIALAAVFLIPYMGIIAVIPITACTVFNASARASIIATLLPFLGLFGLVLMGEYFSCFVGVIAVFASIHSGLELCKGFHRGLMKFILITLAMTVVSVAVYFKYRGITPEIIAESAKILLHDSMTDVISAMESSLPADTAALLVEQYEALAYSAVMYIPGVCGALLGIFGIVAIRLAGLLHDLTGCELYPKEDRCARTGRTFAWVYIAALILGLILPGAAGASAANIMIVMMIPASAAGVSAYREMLRERRERGVRGIPFSLITLIFAFVFFSFLAGLMILSFTGVFAAFSKRGRK